MKKPFITTYTGRKVNPLDLKPEDICILDIAHHLSCINRFVGALRVPMSDAQHSVYVSHLLRETGWEPEGLYHDAAEAYLGDVSKWVKQHQSMRHYREAEDRAWRVICEALSLRVNGAPEVNELVHEADRLMVRFEAYKLGHKFHSMFEIPGYHRPSREEISQVGPWRPWSWQKSKRLFLAQSRKLGYDDSSTLS